MTVCVPGATTPAVGTPRQGGAVPAPEATFHGKIKTRDAPQTERGTKNASFLVSYGRRKTKRSPSDGAVA